LASLSLFVAVRQRISGAACNVNVEAPWHLLIADALLSWLAGERKTEGARMEGSKSVELQLTEVELETLISAVRSTPCGRFPELEFKLRTAWRRALSQSDYRSVIPDVG
jgi:hypothetical protein